MSRRSDDIVGLALGGACLGFVIALSVNFYLTPAEGPSPYMLLGIPFGAALAVTGGLLPEAWLWIKRAGAYK